MHLCVANQRFMVQIDQIIAVSGKSGLFRLVSTKSNGLILEDLETGKVNFFSARTTQFSPLESIGIFTLADNIPLKEIYQRFADQESNHSIPDEKANDLDYKSYFEQLIPEYDRYRVHAKDMKKCLKWYRQLKQLGFIHHSTEAATDGEQEGVVSTTD